METSIDLYADEYANDYNDREEENDESAEILQNEDQNEQDLENENAENKEDNDEEKRKVKPKRIIRNPRPKLNVETLKSHKGLMCLEGYFKNKKFKGSGYESEDLKTIMKTYEYWCHRLFPKFSFDDCITHLEKLGTKKNVQVFMKKIRMDMVVEDEPIIRSDNEDVLESTQQQQFDDLLAQPNETSSLTEEQIERIRVNKERANRLRLERLQKENEQISGSTSQQNYIEDVHSEISERNNSPADIHTTIVQYHQEECASEVELSAK